MKCHFLGSLCMLLLCVVGRVVADKMANPYQMVYLWYAYLLDVKYGQGKTIASGCTNCNEHDLDAFLRHVERVPRKGPWKGTTGLGPNTNWIGPGAPKIEQIADAIRNSGYSSMIDGSKVIPSQVAPGPNQGFKAQFEPVHKHIQQLRQVLPEIDERFDRLRDAIDIANDWRIQAQAAGIKSAITKLSNKNNWGIKPVFQADGYHIDATKTLATCPGYPNVSTDCKDFVRAMQKQTVPPGMPKDPKQAVAASQAHEAVIRDIQGFVSDYDTDVVCPK